MRAQQAPRDPSAEDRAAAADAFDRGTRAYLARDYARAAEWFETAFRMAPAAAALIQAVRAHERAGDRVRAATLALRLRAQYENDRQAMRQAEQTLRAASELVRVDVACEGRCTIELDGTLLEHASFFLAPGSEHVVRASFETGSVEERVRGEAGEVRTLRFVAPPPALTQPEQEPPAEAPARAVEAVAASAPPPPPASAGGLTPVIGLVGAGLTAVAGGILIWSGLDTLDGVPAYEAMPTPERLADGQSRETRTNVLIGVTAGLGLASVVLLVVADWNGAPNRASERDAAVRAFVAPLEGGGLLRVEGSF